jgi:hypothetical protein
MAKIRVAFRNFANAPIKNDHSNAITSMLTKHQFYAVKPPNSSTNSVVIFIKKMVCIQIVITATLFIFTKLP